MTMPALPALNDTNWYAHYTALDTVARNGGGATNSGDKVLYVSKSGNDSNTGLSWGQAKLTIGAAVTALTGNTSGTIYVGAGTFTESPITLSGGKTISGAGRYATIVQLAASGNLFTVSSDNNSRLQHLALAFASSSVTGNLLYHTNAFSCDYLDVRFTGTSTTGQVGYRYEANAGDSHFIDCYFDSLDVGVSSDSTLVHFIGCVFSACVTASAKGGDATGATTKAGAAFIGCTFRGAGARYIHVAGKAQSWTFDGCWFDGVATTAVEVGSGTYGPWLFSMTNCPALAGATNSLIINAAERSQLHGVAFTNTGSNPTELTVDTTNAPRGSIAACMSVQGTKMATKVPPKWLGWEGFAQSSDSTVQLVETARDVDVANFPQTMRRITVRVVNRATGTAAATVTFPSAFETTFGGGQFFKVFDNTAAGVTFSATSITVPTGVAVSSGLIILEGF